MTHVKLAVALTLVSLGLCFVSPSLLLSRLLLSINFFSVIPCQIMLSFFLYFLLFLAVCPPLPPHPTLPPFFMLTALSPLCPSILFWDIDRAVMLARVFVYACANVPSGCRFDHTAAPLPTLSLTNRHTMITFCI